MPHWVISSTGMYSSPTAVGLAKEIRIIIMVIIEFAARCYIPKDRRSINSHPEMKLPAVAFLDMVGLVEERLLVMFRRVRLFCDGFCGALGN